MSEYRAPGASWTTTLSGGTTGQASLWKAGLLNADTGAVVVAASGTGIFEIDSPSGNYGRAIPLPTTPGRYQGEWVKAGVKYLDDSIVEVTYTPPVPAGIADAPYFTPADFKALYPGDTAVQALSDDQINAARLTAEEIIEHECRVAFVPRTKTLALSGDGFKIITGGLVRAAIPLYKIRSVTAVTVNGVTQDVTRYKIESDGVYGIQIGVIPYGNWGFQRFVNASVTVTHGYDAPPHRIRDAAMILTYHRAVRGPIDDRAVSVPAGDAGGTITLLTPGVGSSITGIPEVDGAIIAYRLPKPSSVSSLHAVDSAGLYAGSLGEPV